MPPVSGQEEVYTAYSLALVQEYAYTLDALPLDLSRNFADLRELDAVLSASVTNITAKIDHLTAMITDHAVDRNDRLRLLAEIADEASRLKPGGEDKIRVACQAADNLKTHAGHLTTLLENVPSDDFLAAVIPRATVYPHVATRAYPMPSMAYEGRRRRVALAGQVWGAHESPAKKKRLLRDEDADSAPYGRSPRKERVDSRPRAGGRAKKNDRAASPAESLVSVASHIPHATTSRRGAGAQSVREGSNHSGGRRNGRASATSTPVTTEAFAYPALPPASAHPSLPTPAGQNWRSGPLEGPGVARDPSLPLPGIEDLAEVEGELDGEVDDQLYCVCRKPSHGQMVGCDMEDACPYGGWFHMECLGLKKEPEDEHWFCPWCKDKKKGRGGGRGGKKRGGGSRARQSAAKEARS